MTRYEAFTILELGSNATLDDAKKAFRNLAKQTHPDKDSSHDAAERFRILHTAYKTIVETEQQAQWEREAQAQREREERAQQERDEQVRREPEEQAEHESEEDTEQQRDDQTLDFQTIIGFALIVALITGLLAGGVQLSSSNNSIVSTIGLILSYIPVVVGLFIWKPGCGFSFLLFLILITIGPPLPDSIFFLILFTLIVVALFLNWIFKSDNLPIERNSHGNE